MTDRLQGSRPETRPDAGEGTFGIYIHIPFCVKKCNYCDFLSFLLPCKDRVADYVLGLKREMELAAPGFGGSLAASLYLGGGTPTLLPSQTLKDIFGAVKEHFSFTSHPEVTVEANPGTLSWEKYEEIRTLGVNRLSLGFQSLDDSLLAAMGRVHTAHEARESFYLARAAGFDNINLDLIYGLPGQTREMWQETLTEVAALAPEHVSAYGLSLEEGTHWGDLYRQGRLSLPGEEDWASMHDLTVEILSTAGLKQYEISNYARPGCESVHNLGYWFRRPYIGLGLGAASFINEKRYRNHSSMEEYLHHLALNKFPKADEEMISLEVAMSETMFLGLRTAYGVNLLEFAEKYGRSPQEAFPSVKPLIRSGVLFVEGTRLKLHPDYYGVSNEVFSRFV